MLYNRTLLFIHSIYKSLHLLTLTSPSTSPPTPSGLATTNMDSAFVCAQSCLTICDHMDCSPLGSSVCGIFQARILEWIAISFSRDLPHRDQTCISCGSCIGRQIPYHWATWEALQSGKPIFKGPMHRLYPKNSAKLPDWKSHEP